MVEYELILIGTVGGIIRNLIGFLKAKLKHHEKFRPAKLVAALSWGTGVGIVLTYLKQGYALDLAPFEIVLIAIAGTVMIDELLQAVFSRSKSGGTELNKE